MTAAQGQWNLRNRTAQSACSTGMPCVPPQFTLWGIVNLTPDSFYDGGKWSGRAAAVRHAVDLATEGAAILDLGAASSRPGSDTVPPEMEKNRLLPVLTSLASMRRDGRLSPGTLISADTWRADVASAALEAGADIINDISACSWDHGLMDVVASKRPGYVLMHCMPGTNPETMQDAPSYGSIVDDVVAFFERRMHVLTAAGLPEENIVLDPGIGFGKTAEHNCELLRHMERIMSLGRPVLLGVSNKSLFGDLLGLPLESRGNATAVCTALLAARGVLHHRVHDVAEARRALVLADSFTPKGKQVE